MGQGNGRDKKAELEKARRTLARLPARQKLDALIDAEDAKALVRSLPAPDLYYAIVEVGLQDATEIVQLASPSQFRSFVDLGAWRRDRLDPHEVLTWLRAARAGAEQEDFLKKLDAVDLEVVEHLLRAFVTVHDLEENPDVNPPGVTMESPEGRYLLELHVEGVELSGLRALLQDLFSRGPFEATRLLEATRWELPSELEEVAYRFRAARLEDLGFPSLQEAVSLFAFVDPNTVKGPAPGKKADAQSLAAPSGRVDWVEAALRGLDELERENLEDELRSLSNAVLMAEVQDPGDLDAVRRVGGMARDYLALGLEHLCGADPGLATECVRELPTQKIFGVGFSLTLQLKFAADRLWKEPLSHLGQTWLTLSALQEVLGALRRKRPLRALPVEGADPVPFRSRRELDEAHKRVERARVQVALFRGLLGGDEATARERLSRFAHPLEVLGTERLLAAAAAHAVLDGEAKVAPVPPQRLSDLFGRLITGTQAAPKVNPEATLRVHAAFRQAADEAAAAEACLLADALLRRLCEEWGPLWLAEGKVPAQVGEIVPTQVAQSL